MTQADSTLVLRMSLDSDPAQGQGQALPKGWGSFCSEGQGDNSPHWYAVSPLAVEALQAEFGQEAEGLEHTVHAETWAGLVQRANAQVSLYGRLIDAQ